MAALIDGASRLTRAPQMPATLALALGPRINAGGRIGESTLGVRLLTTSDPEEARAIAIQLSQLNEERPPRHFRGRSTGGRPPRSARSQVSTIWRCRCFSGHGWHPGVIGIVAGRIKEKTGKPAIVIATRRSAQGKGSGPFDQRCRNSGPPANHPPPRESRGCWWRAAGHAHRLQQGSDDTTAARLCRF